MRKKRIAVLGSTGSIGRQTLDVLGRLRDTHDLVLIANGSDADGLARQRSGFPSARAFFSKRNLLFRGAEDAYGGFAPGYLADPETYRDVDIVVNGIAGTAGILPSAAALDAGKILATANKESLVCFGAHLKASERRFGGKIIPVDSEHSALAQCLDGRRDFTMLTVTASGGAFRDLPFERLADAKAKDALKHPNWVMGEKITIDCATMVNKGFELLEAARLFETDAVDAVLHRESVVHALATFRDGSVKASLGAADMRIPIQYALTYPERIDSPAEKLDLTRLAKLSFAPIDEARYPAYAVLKQLIRKGEYEGTVAVAADEVLVELYRSGKIGYFDLAELLDKTLSRFGTGTIREAEDVFRMEREVRAYITSERFRRC